MDEPIRLGASERVAGRPFTDPDASTEDLAALRAMATGLRVLLGRPLPRAPRPLALEAPASPGRQHRAIICDDGRLRAPRDLVFVGFFAKRRPGLDYAPLTRADDELILELPRHPGILSYSSLELADGNWGNLIVVDPPEATEQWREGEKHAYAVREIAPRYYAVVRLHNGVFPGGLVGGADPVLARTKYYAFDGPEPWRAERELRRAT